MYQTVIVYFGLLIEVTESLMCSLWKVVVCFEKGRASHCIDIDLQDIIFEKFLKYKPKGVITAQN